jgi:hypothetical protein
LFSTRCLRPIKRQGNKSFRTSQFRPFFRTPRRRIIHNTVAVIDACFGQPYTIGFSCFHPPTSMNTQPETLAKRPSLDEVMAYQNETVIAGFLKGYAVTPDEARDLFEQTKRMLWLMNEMRHDQLPQTFGIDNSLRGLDAMWHTFILFTRDYQQFCLSLFGRFVHHAPAVPGPEETAARIQEFAGLSPEQVTAKLADEKRLQYTYVFKKLGKDVFIKWYTEFHNKYTAHHLLQLQLDKLNRDQSPEQ